MTDVTRQQAVTVLLRQANWLLQLGSGVLVAARDCGSWVITTQSTLSVVTPNRSAAAGLVDSEKQMQGKSPLDLALI